MTDIFVVNGVRQSFEEMWEIATGEPYNPKGYKALKVWAIIEEMFPFPRNLDLSLGEKLYAIWVADETGEILALLKKAMREDIIDNIKTAI